MAAVGEGRWRIIAEDIRRAPQRDSGTANPTPPWKDLQLEKELQISYNASCPRETNPDKEVGKMFFFFNKNNCNTGCSSIWQILSQICGGFCC